VRVLVLRHGHYPEDPRVRREAAALVARGHEVEVICLRRPGEAAREAVGGVRVRRLPIGHRRTSVARYVREYGAFFAGAAVLATLRHVRRPVDVVQVNTMPDALVFAAIGPKLLGARVMLDLHEVMPELCRSKFGVGPRHPMVRLLAAVERWAVRFADRCLAVSEPCLARHVSRGSPEAKFAVVMNAADPALFPPRQGPPPAREGAPLVVSHGTLVARYGFDLVVRAVARLPGARLEILGEGDERPTLEALARELGVADRVTFAGRVPLTEVAARIGRADVGVVAHRADAFTALVVPTKLLEYVAVGVPAVVARAPAVEAYFDEDMIEMFAPGDVDDLARAIAGLFADEGRRRRLAAAASERFGGRYGWPVMAAAYVAQMEALAAR